MSEVLALTGARCAISRGFTAAGSWGLRFSRPDRLKVTAVTRGRCWLTLEGAEQPVLLSAGEVVVFDGTRPHGLASDPDAKLVDASRLFGECSDPIVRVGEDVDVMVVGGHIDLDRTGEDLLLTTLPPLIHVGADAADAGPLRWLADQLLQEMTATRPGAGFASQQLSQLIFLHVLRVHLAASEPLQVGWLRAIADERIAPALRLMHDRPERNWHLDELARSVAMSRTTFASRFKATAGVPPITYLREWRMRIPARTLRQQDTPISSLASLLGYTSESAFSNAFKRSHGTAPKRYRASARIR
jgi:AraC-like DNA-binding protein